jgi:hypothetical protein
VEFGGADYTARDDGHGFSFQATDDTDSTDMGLATDNTDNTDTGLATDNADNTDTGLATDDTDNTDMGLATDNTEAVHSVGKVTRRPRPAHP